MGEGVLDGSSIDKSIYYRFKKISQIKIIIKLNYLRLQYYLNKRMWQVSQKSHWHIYHLKRLLHLYQKWYISIDWWVADWYYKITSINYGDLTFVSLFFFINYFMWQAVFVKVCILEWIRVNNCPVVIKYLPWFAVESLLAGDIF